MKSARQKLERSHAFYGTYAELKCMFPTKDKKGNDQAEWRDLGVAKQCLNRKDDSSFIWWSDTGHILFQYPKHWADDPTSRGAPLGEPDDYNWDKERKGMWTEIMTGSAKGLTLPQCFFRDPIGFFERHYLRRRVAPEPKYEANEIFDKAGMIRIPRPDAECWETAQQFSQYGPYQGFVIRKKGTLPERHRGFEVINDQAIDLTVPFWIGLDPVFDDGGEMGVSVCTTILIRELDKAKSRVWDRAGCEAFFNDDANFAP